MPLSLCIPIWFLFFSCGTGDETQTYSSTEVYPQPFFCFVCFVFLSFIFEKGLAKLLRQDLNFCFSCLSLLQCQGYICSSTCPAFNTFLIYSIFNFWCLSQVVTLLLSQRASFCIIVINDFYTFSYKSILHNVLKKREYIRLFHNKYLFCIAYTECFLFQQLSIWRILKIVLCSPRQSWEV